MSGTLLWEATFYYLTKEQSSKFQILTDWYADLGLLASAFNLSIAFIALFILQWYFNKNYPNYKTTTFIGVYLLFKFILWAILFSLALTVYYFIKY